MGFFARLRAKHHSVDTIMSDFTAAIARLEASVSFHETAAGQASSTAARYDALAAAAAAEADRATKAAKKVRALVS